MAALLIWRRLPSAIAAGSLEAPGRWRSTESVGVAPDIMTAAEGCDAERTIEDAAVVEPGGGSGAGGVGRGRGAETRPRRVDAGRSHASLQRIDHLLADREGGLQARAAQRR